VNPSDASPSVLSASWLGRLSYADALARQEALVIKKIADPTLPDIVLLLEHEPVYTIGRTPDQSSLRGAHGLPHPLVVTGRGGQATYHGPGQLIGYPILDLKTRGEDLHRYLRALEVMLVAICAHFGVVAERREGLTGSWVGPKKIASIGIGVRRWVSMHGFALNVTGDLTPYQAITPCGIAGVEMTSLSREAGREITVRAVAEVVATLLPTCLSVEAMQAESSNSRSSS
jgi:lipoyl(octanoyl) transferase